MSESQSEPLAQPMPMAFQFAEEDHIVCRSYQARPQLPNRNQKMMNR